MFWRIGTLVLAQLAGAALGAMQARGWGALAGALLASWTWLAVDALRARRVLRWLRDGDQHRAPAQRGLWGEVADRARRLLRQAEHDANGHARRLQDFLAALQASPNGVVLLDADGRIEWCNQTAGQHFGFDAERDLAQSIGNLLRDPAFAAYWNGRDFSREVAMPGPAGTVSRPVRLSVHVHPYGEGRKLMLSRDITAVEQAEAMRRDFVANVSHEMRTPLTVMAGFIETLLTLPLEAAERQRYLDLMAQQAERMQTVVSDLLTLSRLEGSPPPAAGEWTGVASLTAQCEAEARGLSQQLAPGGGLAHRLQAEVDPLLAGAELSGSRGELQSAMSNLVSNAVRYTPAGGLVQLRWHRLPDGSAMFSVRDTGPGIAAEHLPRLTERFYRVDRSRSRESGGTGLGLAIVKHVVQRHGGTLRIDSTPGTGSTFAFVLPPSRVRGALSAA
jgi:two-component system phosphate regulon sensor histidine kinase PhoR